MAEQKTSASGQTPHKSKEQQEAEAKREILKKRRRQAYRKMVLIGALSGGISALCMNLVLYYIQTRIFLRTATEIIYQSDSSGSEDTLIKTEVSPSSDADLVESALPSIVSITRTEEVETRSLLGESNTYENESAGSGIIVAKDSSALYLVTNEHVLGDDPEASEIQFLTGESVNGTVKGVDSAHDLAVLMVPLSSLSNATKSVVTAASVGDSTALRVGDPVVAIGNALGYGLTITKGVVSALNREVVLSDSATGDTITNYCIQTDAAINPGNSGGALLNAYGEVVGINEIKYSREDVEGISYAIPMADAYPIIMQIVERRVITEEDAAFLGIKGVEVEESNARMYDMPRGVYVSDVISGSAADLGGIESGDIIISFDGNTVSSKKDLDSLLRYYAAGDTVEVVIERLSGSRYKEQALSVTLGRKE